MKSRQYKVVIKLNRATISRPVFIFQEWRDVYLIYVLFVRTRLATMITMNRRVEKATMPGIPRSSIKPVSGRASVLVAVGAVVSVCNATAWV